MATSGLPKLPKEGRPKVIVAIPCFNTEPFIGGIVSEARKYVDQVIIVNDGSSDGTVAAAKAAGALVVNHETNRGYGEAIKSCFKAAKTNGADVLVTLDGDGQHDPSDLPRVLAPIVSGEADMVIGSRFLHSKEPPVESQHRAPQNNHLVPGTMPRYRSFGIGAITFLCNLGSRVKVSDSQSGFRSYSRKVIDILDLKYKGMSISVEILDKARSKRFTITEVPIDCSYGPSPFGLKAMGHGLRVALSVVRIRLRNALHGLFNFHE